MSNSEYYSIKFPLSDKQKQLLENFKQLRQEVGTPDTMYMRSLERTKQFTRTVYPQPR